MYHYFITWLSSYHFIYLMSANVKEALLASTHQQYQMQSLGINHTNCCLGQSINPDACKDSLPIVQKLKMKPFKYKVCLRFCNLGLNSFIDVYIEVMVLRVG